jgi:hypothetical protein
MRHRSQSLLAALLMPWLAPLPGSSEARAATPPVPSAATATSTTSATSAPAAMVDGRPRSAFGPGEQTVYAVSYLGVPTGQAVITVGLNLEKFGAQTWPIICTAETTDVGAVYPVKDRYVTFWDPVQRRSVGSEMYADEGRVRHRERVRLDHDSGKAFATKQWEGKPAKDQEYEVTRETIDMAAASMKLRNLPLTVGSEYEIPVFTGSTAFTLRARLTGKEKISTRLGEREALKMRVEVVFGGGLKTNRALQVWVADDKSHLPLRVDADFLIGTMRAEVASYAPGMDFGGADP